ncbi:hypothetical protein EJ06DRAFT_525935 [Trichodelitschia bisporula]|uniref:Integral membrane protein n=1 Tax=Trichodelitschia bisporula TaxID=703511 RepID=A0A6G1IAU1_9PEZI|nr:hypothetical protein EJ06DRAFT_525935 [Trichodelitschia bisporula]
MSPRVTSGASPLSAILLLLSTLTLIPTATAQAVIDQSKLPSCAASCQLLNAAQSLCVPPSAPVTGQTTYQTCFCNSNYLTPFKTTPNGVCDSECSSASDRTAIQQWFLGLCNGGAVVTPSSTDSAAASTSTSSSPKTPKAPTWISTHARWVAMVVVLLVAAIVAIILGVWLRRRHRRKHDVTNSMLGPADAASALRNRHPDAPSVGHPHPNVMMSGARGPTPMAEATPYGQPAPQEQHSGGVTGILGRAGSRLQKKASRGKSMRSQRSNR